MLIVSYYKLEIIIIMGLSPTEMDYARNKKLNQLQKSKIDESNR